MKKNKSKGMIKKILLGLLVIGTLTGISQGKSTVSKDTNFSTDDTAFVDAFVPAQSIPTENTYHSTTDICPENTYISTSNVPLTEQIIPAYSGNPYVVLQDNIPLFQDDQLTTTSFEQYSELDTLGRCGVAFANIGTDLMPTEPRGEIGSIKPAGWHTVKYSSIDGNYLYNRCHLIGYQLSGENANAKNLITGTRYLNIVGMLPFENMVADFVKETNYHVLYRVTPVYTGSNLIADGVIIEGKSVEDNGKGILFHVFCYNIQPGIIIDYITGDSVEETAQVPVVQSQETTHVPSVQSEQSTQVPDQQSQKTAQSSSIQTQTTTQIPNTQSQETSSSKLVWLSATGSKYHSINHCGNMNPNKARQVTEQDAISGGKGKCSKCW